MPAKVTTTNVLGKLGQRLAKAHEQHKGDETNHGFQDLPAGIKGAICKLVSAELGVYKSGDDAGQPFVLLAAVIQEPEFFEGMKLRGRRAQNTYPLCDQPKRTQKARESSSGVIGQWGHDKGSFEENWADFENELRKLGIDTVNAPLGTEAGLRSVLDALTKAGPTVRISTREWENPATKKKMVFTSFDGIVTDYTPTAAGASGFSGGDDEPPTGTGSTGSEGDGEMTLEDMANLAETGDMAGTEMMKDKARAVGITDKEIDDSTSWKSMGEGTSLYELIQAKMNGDGASNEPEPESFEPKVGVICNYQIKVGGKVHQCKIEKIDKKTGTANLLNVTDKVTKYAAVPLAKLSAA